MFTNPRPSVLKRFWLVALCVVLSALFAGLGDWQLQRLQWKNSLIERVQRNTVRPPMLLESSADLATLQASADEYRRVSIDGKPDCNRAIPVWTATQLGSGYWWMVPVALKDGSRLWLNRGYVTPDAVAEWRSGKTSGCGPVAIEGLLRTTQPGGGFLRPNDAVAGRWYSRDIATMSAATGLESTVDAWFVDESATSDTTADGHSVLRPVPGLTALQFPNKHLGYALTWFTLALACVLAGVLALRSKV